MNAVLTEESAVSSEIKPVPPAPKKQPGTRRQKQSAADQWAALSDKEKGLLRYGYFQTERGLYALKKLRNGKQSEVQIGHFLLDVLTKRYIYTVPDRLDEAPREHGVVLVTEFSSLDKAEKQVLEIHRTDMRLRQPKFFNNVHVVKPPHDKLEKDCVDAIESAGMFAPKEKRFDATGHIRIDDLEVFLNPAGGGVTEQGLDERYRVQFPLNIASKLTSVRYGWTGGSGPGTTIEDYQTLLKIRDIAPGAQGYGDVLLGCTTFAPMSQRSETGGVWTIVHGLTGSLKSASSRLGLQCYAHSFHGRDETSTINLREGASTAFAIEQVLYYLGGMFAHCDDGLKGKNVSQKDTDKFYRMLSTIGGHAFTRTGGKRGVWGQGEGGFGIEPYSRGSGVFTVETLPDSEGHASDLARYVVVSLDGHGIVDETLLTDLQSKNAATQMNRATCSFIMWLLPRIQQVLEGVTAREDAFRAEGVHTRTATSYAKLETALYALFQYGVSISAHTEHQAESLLAEVHTNLMRVALRQKAVMGIEEHEARANNTVHIFYELLRRVMREGKLYACDALYRTVQEYSSDGSVSSTVGYRPQPPLFLADENFTLLEDTKPDPLGWRWNESQRVYELHPGGQEAGVLRQEGTSIALYIYTQNFKEVIYPTLVELAAKQNIPLPGIAEMVSKLKEQRKLTCTNPTNLHGRGSQTSRTYILDMTPESDLNPPLSPDTKPDEHQEVTGMEEPIISEETENAFRRYNEARLLIEKLISYGYELEYLPNGLRNLKRTGSATAIPVRIALDELKAQVKEYDAELRDIFQVPLPSETPTPPEGTGKQDQPTPPRRNRASRVRPTVYADIPVGKAVTDSNAVITFAPDCSLSTLLTTILDGGHTCERLYICGTLPQEYAAWLIDTGMFKDYTTGKRGHYFDKDKAENHVARYEHRVSGAEIEIRTIDCWFGDAEYTVEQAPEVMSLLNQYLKHSFTEDAIAYATPALTFQTLWKTENRIHHKEFVPLPEEIRRLIRESSGQGRIELLTPASLKTMTELHYYDGIFMYSALTWGMPTEVQTHDVLNEHAGKVPARYRIQYTVPADWHHIGLFMTPREQVTGRAEDGDTWSYPGEDAQGRTFETWADGAELDALIDHYAPAPSCPPDATKEQTKTAKEQAYQTGRAIAFQAWSIVILERIVFKPEKESAVTKPLDSVTKKLTDMRDRVEVDARTDTTRANIYKLVRGCIRNILLHGIGSFNRTDRDSTYILSENDLAPDGYTSVRPVANGLMIYTVPQKVEAYTQQFEHPEWAALIWARCRARMTKDALSLPRGMIIVIRTDAIAVIKEQPQWDGNEKRGKLRPKWHITRKLQAPHTFEALDKIVDQYAVEGGH